MPTHIYIPRRQPPNMWDRATAHAMEVCTAGFSVCIGLILATRLPGIDMRAPLPITGLPGYILPILCAFVIVGGGLALWGLLIRRSDIRRELNVEQYGWLLLALGWAAYSVALLAAGASGVMTGAASTYLAVSALWRFIALIYIERELDPAARRQRLRGRHR